MKRNHELLEATIIPAKFVIHKKHKNTETQKHIAVTRLKSQQLILPSGSTPEEVVCRLGAVQAQDPIMSLWAIGIRLPGSSEETVREAIAAGSIIRTHVLRPTWHIVPASDVRWMLDLTAPRILSSMKGRIRELELSDKDIAGAIRTFRKVLGDGSHLDRNTLLYHVERAGISTEGHRGAHLLMIGELNQVLCSGPIVGRNNTYALMDSRVPSSIKLSRDEAIYRLAKTYFTGHAPATIEDFKWWSGLTLSDARRALQTLGIAFDRLTVEGKEYVVPSDFQLPAQTGNVVHLLPAFDEFIISYTDRSAALPREYERAAVSTNGIFRPVITVGGQGIGLWKRKSKGKSIRIEARYFDAPMHEIRQKVNAAVADYGAFVEKPADITHGKS